MLETRGLKSDSYVERSFLAGRIEGEIGVAIIVKGLAAKLLADGRVDAETGDGLMRVFIGQGNPESRVVTLGRQGGDVDDVTELQGAGRRRERRRSLLGTGNGRNGDRESGKEQGDD